MVFVICSKGIVMTNILTIDIQKTERRLRDHVGTLTQTIGERSVFLPHNLEKTRVYIENFYREIDLPAHSESYPYGNFTVSNIAAQISFSDHPKKHYIVGAHYDSVVGTVGADDNASAVAVQLETARQLMMLKDRHELDLSVKFVSFPLEEPPAFGTRHMGSGVYAYNAWKTKEQIDGMICLEMVGFTCHDPGCQDYPFPLMFLDYPKQGDFIGIVGNYKSREFTNDLSQAFSKNPDLPVVKLTVPGGGYLLPSVRLSDHSSFWHRGFKAVMITDTAFYRNPHYHRASDTMEKLDYGFMAQLVKSLLIFFLSHVP
jgi:Zn-dependent M28 family amino/carboxypeptidase